MASPFATGLCSWRWEPIDLSAQLTLSPLWSGWGRTWRESTGSARVTTARCLLTGTEAVAFESQDVEPASLVAMSAATAVAAAAAAHFFFARQPAEFQGLIDVLVY